MSNWKGHPIWHDSKDVRLPVQMQRAMAAEAEAAREARAKVIAAEGEQKASHALAQAADTIAASPAALQVFSFSYGIEIAKLELVDWFSNQIMFT